MNVQLLDGFAAALTHLSDAEFFAALGMALFGLAGAWTTRSLRRRPKDAAETTRRIDQPEAA